MIVFSQKIITSNAKFLLSTYCLNFLLRENNINFLIILKPQKTRFELGDIERISYLEKKKEKNINIWQKRYMHATNTNTYR